MARYLIDNGVLQRLPRSTAVRQAISDILDAEEELCCCAATLDEFAFSARSESARSTSVTRLRSDFTYLPMRESIDERIIDIRAALFQAGMGRAAGVMDVQIAATAADYDAVVLHYDHDFDHISEVYPNSPSRWIVPRGSIP